MSDQELTTIYLDPKKWLRGCGSYKSQLWDSRAEKGCCIGIACLQLGVDREVIDGMGALDDLEFEDVEELPKALAWLLSDDSIPVYNTNDKGFIPLAERVDRINALTEPHGLRFVLQETP